MQSTTEISQKGLNDMKELNIMEATVLTSPNPLTLICSKKEDGSTNLAPICFVSYLSFNPPMVGFATGKQSHTGKRVRETGKVIVTVPGESLAGVVMACGASTGAKTDKVAANNIEMMAVEGSDIQIPEDTRLAMVATLQQLWYTHALHFHKPVYRITMGQSSYKNTHHYSAPEQFFSY